jgi:cytochrome c oxidase cbb3-type subunit 3
MNTKKTIFIISITLLGILSLSLKSIKNEESYQPIIPKQKYKQSYLVKYGEYIFNRESCRDCHSLNIEENPNLISLDGLKNKYTDIWHYIHLVDPELVSLNTTMPSYKKLNDNDLNLTIFESKLNFNVNDWNVLINQADNLFKNLKKNYIKIYELDKNNNDINKRTEIIALIAYLQSIPASKDLIKRDSIENIKIQNDYKNLEDLLNNHNSIIYKEASSKESIEKGENIFKQNCYMCHGMQGEGKIGPNLTDDYWLYGGSDFEIAKVIALGAKPGKGMIAWYSILKPEELGQVFAFIKSLKGTNPENAKRKEGKKE